jgi:K+-transporting ATPase ATPase A chain
VGIWPGSRRCDGAQFIGLLVGTVVIVGGLTFLPALALGPVRSSSPCGPE